MSATKLLSKITLQRSLLAALQRSLLVVFLLALAVAPAAAQEPEGVRYIVQPGDTLSSISLRFDVSVNDIIQASGIANPNALNVGDVLIIPGIDWIEGTLVIENVPLGESFLSLKRRYLLSDESMARLNQLTSPEQLYVGFPAMLATEHGELTDSARAVVPSGGSLLEMAAATGDNPWRLAAVNQLPATWAAVAGDVLFTPGRQAVGPGGLPSEITSLSLDAPGFVQGKTLVLRADAAGIMMGGEFFEHPLNFIPQDDGSQIALQGVPLQAESGTYDFTLGGTLPNGSTFTFTQPVRVASGGYETETLTVDLQFLDPDKSDAETAAVNAMVTSVSPIKMWAGYWAWPHPDPGVINSEFGIHRSYNQGVYQNYHFGVDFGGGVGFEIWAPAPGTVVFAGPLEIRGNFTLIDHGWGVYTAYAHQSEIRVNVGDQVQTGQLIGLVGGTGRVSGAHLHWEVIVGGVPVEPLDWVARIYP